MIWGIKCLPSVEVIGQNDGMKTGRPRLKVSAPDDVKAEVARRLKVEQNALFRDRLRAVQMSFDGIRRYEDIARQLGRAKSAVQNWLQTFTTGGIEALLTRKKAPGKASPMQAAQIQKAIVAGLKEGRWRTGQQFAAWLRQQHRIDLSLTQIYYWLGKFGGALKVPRPVHIKKDEAAAEAFKAHLFEALCQLNIPAGSQVRIWALDEARIGLHDPPRRCWGLRGVRVVKPRQQEYEWCYVYGALEVVEGQSEFRLMPTVGLDLTRAFLEQIAASAPEAHHVILWDQAGFHPRPGDPDLPPRIHLLPFPAYSPELNPPERLWDIIKDQLCNRLYQGIAAMEEAACSALQPFITRTDRVRELVGQGWLHLQANAS